MSGEVLASVELRPAVPMGAYHALGYICVLGAVEALRAQEFDVGIGWPFSIVDAQTYAALAEVRVRAGYDEGMFARCEVVALQEGAAPFPADVLVAGVTSRVDAWASDVAAGRAKAGPVAPVLSDYFDLVPLLGRPVRAFYPNGRVMAQGTFAGIDIWGRATLRTGDGRELEFAPEQASIASA
ncbi:MAG: hypothetical protein IJ781_07645 [Atopobiaceae bacterium]|nr:hypothetical protein [Atopobiaceae bacterium]